MQGITANPCTLKEVLQVIISDLLEVNEVTEEAKAARRAYKKKWQQDNADKVREYQRRYWEKKAKGKASEAAQEQPQG